MTSFQPFKQVFSIILIVEENLWIFLIDLKNWELQESKGSEIYIQESFYELGP